MNIERIRQLFEEGNPLPDGVRWDGSSYAGTHNTIGSYANATIWNHMFSGFCQGYAKFATAISKEALS